MGRSPCCEKAHTNKGAWTKEEDQRLINYIRAHGEGCWRSLPKAAGLLRCGKSCRLRWINYLRPDLKRGNFTDEEDELIIKLHSLLGNKWSLIAGRLPGRTDNEIKNYWNTHIKRKLIGRGLDPQTHRPLNADAETATSTSPLELINASPPSLPLAEITLINGGINYNNDKPTAEFKPRTDSGSSGVTTDETQQQQQQQQQQETYQQHRDNDELNLELSIGLVPSGTPTSSANCAESELRQLPLQFFASPAAAAAAVVAGPVGLCCHLGFQSRQACGSCQSTNGFYRYQRPLDL
ncbi:hypothetical protein L1049_025434 [Liquidambar formosana]|uniref:Uncharacterized protein n=1 Tax=Liquidambar formosana TaxID=63359 RepID=A0AAP0NCT0_LIQFO